MRFKITLLIFCLLLGCLCLFATRKAQDMQKEVRGEASVRAWLISVGDTPPGYVSGAPGAVKYFDTIGSQLNNEPVSKERNAHGRPD
jgi:hypothetical protein